MLGWLREHKIAEKVFLPGLGGRGALLQRRLSWCCLVPCELLCGTRHLVFAL